MGMYNFSDKSKRLLKECHPDLQKILVEVLKVMDISILCAYRDKIDQDTAFAQGKSKLKFPHSKHNKNPSFAVDICPYPIDWNNHKAFYFMAGVFKAKAESLGIKVRWGGDWNNDNNFQNDSFLDLPHFELV